MILTDASLSKPPLSTFVLIVAGVMIVFTIAGLVILYVESKKEKQENKEKDK